MRMIYPGAAAVALVMATAGPAARGQATMPAQHSFTPEFASAFEKLASAEFSEREQAIGKLQQLLARQMRQTIALQEVLIRVQQDLSHQLRLLTGRASADAEADARVAGLLEFNQAVSRWAGDCMVLPSAQREAMLRWGASDTMLPLIGQLYSRSIDTRMAAVRELGNQQGTEQVNWMLLQMMNDPERSVSLTAMDVLYYREPDAAIIEGLWNRALNNIQMQMRGAQQRGRNRSLVVAERTVTYFENDPGALARNLPDADIAADLLVKFKDPKVGERLDEFFREMGRLVQSTNDSRWRVMMPNYGDGNRVLGRLIEAYQPKEAVRFLAKVIDQNMTDGSETTMTINGQQEKFRMSSRVEAMVMLLKSTGQSPEDYGIVRMQNYNPERYAVKGSLPEEQAVVKKVQEWWKAHAKDYGGEGLP